MQLYEPQLVHGVFFSLKSFNLIAALKLLQICPEFWVLTVQFSLQLKPGHLAIATV